MQWNARGLRGRLSDFRQRVFKYQFPVIVICEPNMDSSFRISGYVQIWSRNDQTSSKVLVCVRHDLVYFRHDVPSHTTNDYVCLTIKHRWRTFSVIGGYIHPRARIDCSHLMSVLQASQGPHIVIGDFNAHHPLWGSTMTNTRGKTLADFMCSQGLYVLNDGSPTFIRGTTYSSCLDLTFVSRSLLSSASWSTDVETHGSDHLPTYVQFSWFRHSASRCIRQTDWTLFKTSVDAGCQSDISIRNRGHHCVYPAGQNQRG